MAIAVPRRRAVRIAALVAVLLVSASAVFTYLFYYRAFTPVATVTILAERAGLVLDRDAKVKYLGVQVGNVSAIEYDGHQARLTLSIRRDQLGYIPSNATVRIASTTVFGAKAVEFLEPAQPAPTAVVPDAQFTTDTVAVEPNTLFQTLVDTLNKIDPVQLNATMSALSEGLGDNGEDVGASISDANDFLAQLNPKLPTLQADLQRVGETFDIYADAAPDLITTLDNVPTISDTLVDQQDNLNATLLAAVGVANEGEQTLSAGADDYIAAMQRLRAPLKVLSDYSPEYGCVLQALADTLQKLGPYFGGLKPSLFVSAGLLPGAPAYTYPESLPIVNASGGPNCRGLPNLPAKQSRNSWYRPPFLVTDNAYVPYQPNTELQFDAPSTLQFLFNGAYAELDDY
ncbi:MCE-family protein [Mycolicibacterium celeriflavum]|uniref:MCE-family protein Mce4A n=1 Tax=Mycolicibacterium celeriflavum TaxID=1249101 RepID=A0A1X0BK22_MYCCF|nr:MCE family protein [Mycolicibacterium celeriflavum]MCV7238515.1 MCE family protein [Mycolicibacterium celeriflavum]OBG16696.1 MCE-family protein [Mycolicibacterium celeriflavum]ORA42409.1 MCE-family protein [Mycolicibacterium celeriflavum]BBY46379.1 MCE-family protein Mce4A [Mycolicibacterium celeriflavum]